jgi:hypothetical protein
VIVFLSTDGDGGRVGVDGECKPGSLGDLPVGVVGIWMEMDTLGLAARPGVLGVAGARSLSLSGCGAVWHSHGLAAAIQRSDQHQPQLGQPGSMYIGGLDDCVGAARPEEDEAGFLFRHWTHVQESVQQRTRTSYKSDALQWRLSWQYLTRERV